MKLIRTDIMEVGKQYVAEHELEKFLKVARGIELEIHHMMPFMQGDAINTILQQFRLPKVSGFGWDSITGLESERGACYGVYAIRATYINCTIVSYLIDSGSSCATVAVDVFEREEFPEYLNSKKVKK